MNKRQHAEQNEEGVCICVSLRETSLRQCKICQSKSCRVMGFVAGPAELSILVRPRGTEPPSPVALRMFHAWPKHFDPVQLGTHRALLCSCKVWSAV